MTYYWIWNTWVVSHLHPWGTFDWYITNPPDLRFQQTMWIAEMVNLQYFVMVCQIFHPPKLLPVISISIPIERMFHFLFSFTCGCPHPSPLEYHPRLHHKSLCSACEDDLFLCLAIKYWHESVLCTRGTWGNGSTSPCCSSALLLEAGTLKHRTRTWKPRFENHNA